MWGRPEPDRPYALPAGAGVLGPAGGRVGAHEGLSTRKLHDHVCL